MRCQINNPGERGATLLEFTFTAVTFFMMLVAIVAGGHLYWTHNALVEATRRGARYAANQCRPNDGFCPNATTADERIRNVAVYGTSNPTGSEIPFVNNLQTTNVNVTRNNFQIGAGTVTVSITGYNYNFVVPGISTLIQMPPYRTTLTGENAGYIPANK